MRNAEIGEELTVKVSKRKPGIARIVTLLGALLEPGVALAQNCALCYTQAASAGSRMIEALRSGILILMLPPMLICLGITWMAYKKRNQFNEEQQTDELMDGPKRE